MKPESERRIWSLRIELAEARAEAADHYKMIAAAAFVGAALMWAWVTAELEGEAERGGQALCILLGVVFGLCWWTAVRHHQATLRALDEEIAACRGAGHTVSVMRSGTHVS